MAKFKMKRNINDILQGVFDQLRLIRLVNDIYLSMDASMSGYPTLDDVLNNGAVVSTFVGNVDWGGGMRL